MTYSTAVARQEMLDAIAEAIDGIGVALAALGEAYELVDDHTGERLEGELFRPVQLAYGRAKRTHGEFAQRHDLPGRTFEPATPGHPSQGVKGFVDGAVHAIAGADAKLASLQDSMMTIEVGDAELREGLSEVRRLANEVPGRARLFVRTLGR
ncbi:MAG: hypothetical protein JWN65_2530 [Solirubrobacterales bacterium]|jgi:hypothetical protein|nr:hypothetical protein [Solirubrobacterales bacterium]